MPGSALRFSGNLMGETNVLHLDVLSLTVSVHHFIGRRLMWLLIHKINKHMNPSLLFTNLENPYY